MPLPQLTDQDIQAICRTYGRSDAPAYSARDVRGLLITLYLNLPEGMSIVDVVKADSSGELPLAVQCYQHLLSGYRSAVHAHVQASATAADSESFSAQWQLFWSELDHQAIHEGRELDMSIDAVVPDEARPTTLLRDAMLTYLSQGTTMPAEPLNPYVPISGDWLGYDKVEAAEEGAMAVPAAVLGDKNDVLFAVKPRVNFVECERGRTADEQAAADAAVEATLKDYSNPEGFNAAKARMATDEEVALYMASQKQVSAPWVFQNTPACKDIYTFMDWERSDPKDNLVRQAEQRRQSMIESNIDLVSRHEFLEVLEDYVDDSAELIAEAEDLVDHDLLLPAVQWYGMLSWVQWRFEQSKRFPVSKWESDGIPAHPILYNIIMHFGIRQPTILELNDYLLHRTLAELTALLQEINCVDAAISGFQEAIRNVALQYDVCARGDVCAPLMQAILSAGHTQEQLEGILDALPALDSSIHADIYAGVKKFIVEQFKEASVCHALAAHFGMDAVPANLDALVDTLVSLPSKFVEEALLKLVRIEQDDRILQYVSNSCRRKRPKVSVQQKGSAKEPADGQNGQLKLSAAEHASLMKAAKQVPETQQLLGSDSDSDADAVTPDAASGPASRSHGGAPRKAQVGFEFERKQDRGAVAVYPAGALPSAAGRDAALNLKVVQDIIDQTQDETAIAKYIDAVIADEHGHPHLSVLEVLTTMFKGALIEVGLSEPNGLEAEKLCMEIIIRQLHDHFHNAQSLYYSLFHPLQSSAGIIRRILEDIATLERKDMYIQSILESRDGHPDAAILNWYINQSNLRGRTIAIIDEPALTFVLNEMCEDSQNEQSALYGLLNPPQTLTGAGQMQTAADTLRAMQVPGFVVPTAGKRQQPTHTPQRTRQGDGRHSGLFDQHTPPHGRHATTKGLVGRFEDAVYGTASMRLDALLAEKKVRKAASSSQPQPGHWFASPGSTGRTSPRLGAAAGGVPAPSAGVEAPEAGMLGDVVQSLKANSVDDYMMFFQMGGCVGHDRVIDWFIQLLSEEDCLSEDVSYKKFASLELKQLTSVLTSIKRALVSQDSVLSTLCNSMLGNKAFALN
jgi:hypothetical protein